MLNPVELAEYYYKLSNERNLEEIEKLFTDTTTYYSEYSGLFLGTKQIMIMQTIIHGEFESLSWDIKTIEEISPGIVLVYFDFFGIKKTKEIMKVSGSEHIVVVNGKIQHIKIDDKTEKEGEK